MLPVLQRLGDAYDLSVFFLDPRCRLSSLSVSFYAHAKHNISYHIMRNDIVLLLACQKRTDAVRVYTVWHSAFAGAAEVD